MSNLVAHQFVKAARPRVRSLYHDHVATTTNRKLRVGTLNELVPSELLRTDAA